MTATNPVKIGYAISAEEHHPSDIIVHAQRAEEIGFEFALISDHFHPWVSEQGHSPFVWSVLGAIAANTRKLRIGTGVTCPLIRIHPAIIAQAAATVAAMMPGRFFLGVGTGENLNEHILGDHWPPYNSRAEMLQEAVDIMRQLWQGDLQSHYGKYYTVENAQLYTLPDNPPEIMVAASGPESAVLAGEIGDGLISTSPDSELIDSFENQGSPDRPKIGKLTVCWAESTTRANKIAHQYWPTAALKGELKQELPLPAHFESAAENISEEDIAAIITCGNDPQPYLSKIQDYVQAGFDHVYIHQIGPDQSGFFNFYQEHIMPALVTEGILETG